jgi:hypothetical protein
LRDHLGLIVVAASIVPERCRDAEDAEATAIWAGMNLAIHHNLKLAVLESDNAVVVATVIAQRLVCLQTGMFTEILICREIRCQTVLYLR